METQEKVFTSFPGEMAWGENRCRCSVQKITSKRFHIAFEPNQNLQELPEQGALLKVAIGPLGMEENYRILSLELAMAANARNVTVQDLV